MNVRELVLKSVGENDDFHFYVDELTDDNRMPTYEGNADEKYTFDEMDDAFFDFLKRKQEENGIYIRLVFAKAANTPNGRVYRLEYCGSECEFKTNDLKSAADFDFADYGIRLKGDEVTLGGSVDAGDGSEPVFSEFLSGDDLLSPESPLNQCVIKIIEKILDE